MLNLFTRLFKVCFSYLLELSYSRFVHQSFSGYQLEYCNMQADWKESIKVVIMVLKCPASIHLKGTR